MGLSVMYGILGEDYFLAKENNDIVVINNENNETGMIVDVQSMGKYPITIEIYNEISSEITSVDPYQEVEQKAEILNQYIIPFYALFESYEDLLPENYLDGMDFNELVLRNLLEQNVSVDDILYEYRNLCNVLGVDSHLESINEKLHLN